MKMAKKTWLDSLASPSTGWIVVIFTAPFLPTPFNIIIGIIGFLGIALSIYKLQTTYCHL